MSTPKFKADILIVDDTPANLELLLRMLREQSYKARVTTTGAMALAAARLSPPELIMLDITMPGMDGYEVCKQLKADERTKDIPVIFISALDEPMDKVKAFNVGGVDYITKPFRFEEVIARVETHLKISRLQRELERKNAELQRKNEELIRLNNRARMIFNALSEALPGQVIGSKYKLESKIGSGGFGVVYKAQHVDIRHTVAVKIFQPKGSDSLANTKAKERFRLEGISACRINHINALQVLDFGLTEEGLPYLVMELLNGHTLKQELRQKTRLPLARALQIILPVCNVLSVAHAAGVIHRDIKPDNIFLHTSSEGEEIVKVVDFGIAKIVGEVVDLDMQDLTVAGRIVGTPVYMSPERLSNQSYDGKSDVYSVGIMLYQMLSGQLPFFSREKDLLSIAMLHLTKEPPRLREIVPDIPPAIEQVVLLALAKDPAKRPTAKELMELLVKASGESVTATRA
ncbi:MAG: protein kinase [Acidobacteriota bacterium]|nr:protein kinase [Blastocatellia bacterium]MDW8412737.1 protein kinase [Acidobacteriota bacterium]